MLERPIFRRIESPILSRLGTFRELASGGLNLGYKLVFGDGVHSNLKPIVLRVDGLHIINQAVLNSEDWPLTAGDLLISKTQKDSL